MGRALNTTVNGSAGTCLDAANALRAIYTESVAAADAARDARGTADASWHGPAHDQFVNVTDGIDREIDAMGDRAFTMEWALRDFAAALDSVNTRMDSAIAKAHAAGLRVDGPFIVAPEPPAQPRLDGGIPTSPEGARQIAASNHAAINAYNGQVADYNTKAAAYNEAKHIVEAARKAEGEAHDALGRVMGQKPGDLVKIGLFVGTRAASAVGSLENGRDAAQRMVDKLTERGRIYTDWANGLGADVTPESIAAFRHAADRAGKDADKYRARVDEYDRFTKTIPQIARSGATEYPGKNVLQDLPDHTDWLAKGGAKVLKGMPFVGSMLTAGTEAWGAYKGEQSWGKAALHTGTNITGGALGGALTGAAAGALGAGPVGAVVAGTVGGIGGAMGLTWFVDAATEPYHPPDTSDLHTIDQMPKS